MALYATAEEIKSLGVQTDASTEDVWDVIAESASRQFDRLCEVNDDFFAVAPFNEEEPPEPILTEKVFYGSGTQYLSVAPNVSIDSVEIDGTTLTPEFRHVDRLLVMKSDSPIKEWACGATITINGHWGWASVPADVKLAVMKLAIFSWRMADPINAEQINAAAEPMVDGVPASVWSVVDKYKAMFTRSNPFV